MNVTVFYAILLKAFLSVTFVYVYAYYKYEVFHVDSFIGSLVIAAILLLIIYYLKPELINLKL